jgi:DNA-binding HxlR family transcriptional regulator
MKKARFDGSRCSVSVTADLIGGKWKTIVLFYLLEGTLRFNELRREIPGVTQRMLTLQLRELEQDGLVERIVHPVIPPHVDYRLTPLGRTLEPVIREMASWGRRYRKRFDVA